MVSHLYPQQNQIRNRIELSGIWDFAADPQANGADQGWFNGLPQARPMAVPGSWNEQYADLYAYWGRGWYTRSFWVPRAWENQRIFVRVGSANYAAQAWLNGQALGGHEGGHLPFEFEMTGLVRWDAPNLLALCVENELQPNRVPPGNVHVRGGGAAAFMSGYPSTSFDFYPYAGLHRPVWLYSVPQTYIQRVATACELAGETGRLHCRVWLSDEGAAGVVTLQGGGQTYSAALHAKGAEAEAWIEVPQARLWSPEDPYLYTLCVRLAQPGGVLQDEVTLPVGLRTVQATPGGLLLNGKPVYLKGFGRHEDFYASGRGLNLPLMIKDYALLKWVGANSYRTSHYPYSEEEMDLADREGILIIDEIPAVGLQFEDGEENIHRRLEVCQAQLEALIGRDINHPSVVMWSVANEPLPPQMMQRLSGGGAPGELDRLGTETLSTLIELAHRLDPSRPATLVGVMGGPLEWLALADVVCINRYWGWYTQMGQLEAGFMMLDQELDGLYEALHKPILLTEFGADTVAGMHSHPAKMFTEEYQVEFLRGYLDVLDQKPYVIGAHVWNFADFQATQSTTRVGGMNLKGVFTRFREPKMAAHFLRERWTCRKAPPAAAPQAEKPAAAAAAVPLPVLLAALAQRMEGQFPAVNCRLGLAVEGEGELSLVLQNGHCAVIPGIEGADALMRLKAEDARRLLAGELSPMAAVMTGKMKVSGDVQTLMLFEKLK